MNGGLETFFMKQGEFDTIHHYYWAGNILSEKYPDCNSIEETKHYQTNIL